MGSVSISESVWGCFWLVLELLFYGTNLRVLGILNLFYSGVTVQKTVLLILNLLNDLQNVNL